MPLSQLVRFRHTRHWANETQETLGGERAERWADEPACVDLYKGVSCQSQLADDVSGDVCFDALAFFGVSFSSLQNSWMNLHRHNVTDTTGYGGGRRQLEKMKD
ncbi:hypothetical protein INR49_030706 [Caranx melampygus]|nr:hypothetical protein INR49_030706 [Caranx melampygus]